ncbi:MAG: ABC transporter ATP-binding protein, partial [Actinobacteria bacterium]|nr:ABC transporter ATP-binding protein [Actinomycetota bacterium]
LLELKAEGQTILLVEHKLDLVMTVSDRIIVMDGGRVIAVGTPEAVRSDPAVIEAYLGRRRGAEEGASHD